MGNCCSDDKAQPDAFQGQGHRLGAAHETEQTPLTTISNNKKSEDNNHNTIHMDPPIHVDPHLSQTDREDARAARLAAAESRLKQTTINKPKKVDPTKNAPLRGPNSQPTMRWTS